MARWRMHAGFFVVNGIQTGKWMQQILLCSRRPSLLGGNDKVSDFHVDFTLLSLTPPARLYSGHFIFKYSYLYTIPASHTIYLNYTYNLQFTVVKWPQFINVIKLSLPGIRLLWNHTWMLWQNLTFSIFNQSGAYDLISRHAVAVMHKSYCNPKFVSLKICKLCFKFLKELSEC